jgi:ABC-type nickel/cobalt efflux system permease component RcnA
LADATLSLLFLTSVATALFHTLIPDHWLPFVLIGRARGWSLGTTAAVSGISALLHTGLSIVLALVALAIGLRTAHAGGVMLERASGVLLLAFGGSYALWAWRKGGHFHPGGALLHGHAHEDCDGREGDLGQDHLHYHADTDLIHGRAGRSALWLAAIVGLNPCVLLLPVVLATAERGAAAIALVTLAYAATTTLMMMGLSVAGVAGLRRLSLPWGARYMEPLSGALIAVVGLVLLLLER